MGSQQQGTLRNLHAKREKGHTGIGVLAVNEARFDGRAYRRHGIPTCWNFLGWSSSNNGMTGIACCHHTLLQTLFNNQPWGWEGRCWEWGGGGDEENYDKEKHSEKEKKDNNEDEQSEEDKFLILE